MKNRTLTLTLSLLLSLLISSAAYASLTRSLKFTGSVVSTPPLNLELANPVIGSMRQDENIDLDPDKKNLSFHIILTQPGDQRLITFQVENSSSLPARLQNLTGQDPPSTTGVYVVWPELDDVLLMPGAESPEYSILVIWDPSAFGAPAADITLHASLQYTQDAEGGR